MKYKLRPRLQRIPHSAMAWRMLAVEAIAPARFAVAKLWREE